MTAINNMKSGIIHDLNNLIQKAMFKGDDMLFHTCCEVDRLFNFVFEHVYEEIVEEIAKKEDASLFFRSHWSNLIALDDYSPQQCKQIRVDALTELKRQIESGELDHLIGEEK